MIIIIDGRVENLTEKISKEFDNIGYDIDKQNNKPKQEKYEIQKPENLHNN